MADSTRALGAGIGGQARTGRASGRGHASRPLWCLLAMGCVLGGIAAVLGSIAWRDGALATGFGPLAQIGLAPPAGEHARGYFGAAPTMAGDTSEQCAAPPCAPLQASALPAQAVSRTYLPVITQGATRDVVTTPPIEDTNPIPTPPAESTAPAPAAPTERVIAAPSTAVPGDPNALQPGRTTLSATFSSIGIELLFAGDANGNATAQLAFKRTADTTWRAALPLWRTASAAAPGPAFYGSALLLEAGTSYDVRVTLSDPDGVAGPTELTGTVNTRAETILPAAALQPTHYVSADGSDDGDGRTPATAWRTLDKAAREAPASAVVQVGPGYYRARGVSLARPVTFVAQYPAVDDERREINAGLRSVVEYGVTSAPAGSSEPHAGVWQQVQLTGPRTGGTFTVWRWSHSGIDNPQQMGYAATRDGLPNRLAHWRHNGAGLQTPAGWAELVHTNLSYNYGFYSDGDAIYLRLPGDANPNAHYVTAGKGSAFEIEGPDVRLSGFEVRPYDFGVYVSHAAQRLVIDHSLFVGSLHSVHMRSEFGEPSHYSSEVVIERNRFRDTNLWTADHANAPAIPWTFVKGAPLNADGSGYDGWRVGGNAESTAVGGRGGAQRLVVRHNTIEGTFNGVGAGENGKFDRYAWMNMDVHDNLIRHVPDDALEPEGAVINFRAWNNRLEHTATVLSTGPLAFGPVYLFRNVAWRTGSTGVGRDRLGQTGVGSVFFKYSGRSLPPAQVYVLHNTFWTDQPGVSGGAQYAGGGPSPEVFHLRNNVFQATRYAFSAPTAPWAWDEDYNTFSTTDATRGFEYGRRYTDDVAGYRAASGEGTHTNLTGSFVQSVALANAATGDLRLPGGSPLIDAGTPVPNVSDRPGVDYRGGAPDLGALEQ